jgi:hypothetical protein
LFAFPGFTHTVDKKWTAALLKATDDINAPDYGFELILAWARGASTNKYTFHPQGGLDCAHNVTVLVKSIANATQLLPSVLLVSSPHSPPCHQRRQIAGELINIGCSSRDICGDSIL